MMEAAASMLLDAMDIHTKQGSSASQGGSNIIAAERQRQREWREKVSFFTPRCDSIAGACVYIEQLS